MHGPRRQISVLALALFWVIFQVAGEQSFCRCMHRADAEASSSVSCCCADSEAASDALFATATSGPGAGCHGAMDTSSGGSCCSTPEGEPQSSGCAGAAGYLVFGQSCGCQPDSPVLHPAPSVGADSVSQLGEAIEWVVVGMLPRARERAGPGDRAALQRLTVPAVDVFLRVSHLLI